MTLNLVWPFSTTGFAEESQTILDRRWKISKLCFTSRVPWLWPIYPRHPLDSNITRIEKAKVVTQADRQDEKKWYTVDISYVQSIELEMFWCHLEKKLAIRLRVRVKWSEHQDKARTCHEAKGEPHKKDRVRNKTSDAVKTPQERSGYRTDAKLMSGNFEITEMVLTGYELLTFGQCRQQCYQLYSENDITSSVCVIYDHSQNCIYGIT